MKPKYKPLSVEEVKYSNMLTRVYNSLALQQTNWTCNLSTGQNINSSDFPNFSQVPEYIRKAIRTFRFQINDNRYTISRKVNSKIIKGFFYHIKAKHTTIVGELKTEIPYVEERVGFCYNRNGDALCVHISHYNFLKVIKRRKEKIRLLFGEYKPYKELFPEDKEADPEKLIYVQTQPFLYIQEVHDILAEPIQYQTEINSYLENINGQVYFLDGTVIPEEERQKRSVRINHSLFGSFDLLEDSTTPPRFFENNQEIVEPFASNV